MELQFYKLPFHKAKYGSWVYDKNGNFIFQFEPEYVNGDYTKEFIELRDKVLAILNGDTNETIDNVEVIDDILIHVNGKEFITIRGWGNLTGTGGHNFSGDKAAEIQDNFVKWILYKLKQDNGKDNY